VRAVLALAGGVGADRRADKDGRGVDGDRPAGYGQGEAVEAPGGGAVLLLLDPAVLRTVAGALGPPRALAPRDPASEMDTALVQGHVAGLQGGRVDLSAAHRRPAECRDEPRAGHFSCTVASPAVLLVGESRLSGIDQDRSERGVLVGLGGEAVAPGGVQSAVTGDLGHHHHIGP